MMFIDTRYYYHFCAQTKTGTISDGMADTSKKILTGEDYAALKERLTQMGLVKDDTFVITSLTYLGKK